MSYRIPSPKILEYISLLKTHGAKTNLVASIKETELLGHTHDSLLIAPTLDEKVKSLIDLGSGGGFPVIPLAIVKPEIHFTAVDSSERKCDFLELVKFKLGIENLAVIHSRIEDLKDHHKAYDVVTARALKPLTELLPLAAPFIKDDGRLIFLKGEQFKNEIDQAKEFILQLGLTLISKEIHRDVPGRDYSVVLEFRGATTDSKR